MSGLVALCLLLPGVVVTWFVTGFPDLTSVMAVSMNPGAIEFAVMPKGPSLISSVPGEPWMPASATARFTTAWTCTRSVTSAGTGTALPPFSRIAAAASSAACSLGSTTATAGPSVASRPAIAAPIPVRRRLLGRLEVSDVQARCLLAGGVAAAA